MLKVFLEFIVTFFFVGKIRFAPGTFGSLAAFPFAYLMLLLITKYHILTFFNSILGTPEIIGIFILLLAVDFILFIIGVITSSLYIKKYSSCQDPKEIVIDEVVGQVLTSILCFFGNAMIAETPLIKDFSSEVLNFVFIFLLPFTLFRVFDIFKPWPIGFIDQNVKGGLGVMLDDVLAAIFATVIFYSIIFGILNFYAF
jgi:phosphatidylglycerophosphatase A